MPHYFCWHFYEILNNSKIHPSTKITVRSISLTSKDQSVCAVILILQSKVFKLCIVQVKPYSNRLQLRILSVYPFIADPHRFYSASAAGENFGAAPATVPRLLPHTSGSYPTLPAPTPHFRLLPHTSGSYPTL
jgi:hypothetical protein